MGDIVELPKPTTAMQQRLSQQLAQRHGPDWDPVLRLAEIAENPDWPKSLRIDALKTVAKYVRPQYQSIPDQNTINNQRPTIVIVDHTRRELLVNAPPGARVADSRERGEEMLPAVASTSSSPPREPETIEHESATLEPKTPISFQDIFGDF